jgi:DNA-binding MarR family transcriptional regulator
VVSRAERNATNPDLGVLSARLLFAVQRELFAGLAAAGFGDLGPRHGAVRVDRDPEGVRATELSRLSGQHKQVVGTTVDELEAMGYVARRPDPADRRAKLVCPTERGLAQMRTADRIMATMQERHARRVGRDAYREFKRTFTAVTDAQRRYTGTDQPS